MKSIHIGALKDKVAIQEFNLENDQEGGFLETIISEKLVWAHLEPIVPKSSDIFWLGNQRLLPATYHVTLQTQPLPEKFHLSWQGKILKLLTKPTTLKEIRWLHFLVREYIKEA